MPPTPASTLPEPGAAYRAISGRDPRFDGRLFVGVLSTGIYCRPSCPARTPLPQNCRFYPAAAAAVAAGFRACRRCRPDSLPGSREWDARGDLAARALRAIADGAIDRSGVGGLADSLHVSTRQLHRILVAEVGASALQLARTRRAQLARMLIDQTALSMIDVAFAAGFASLRQFNDVMREEFGAPPSTLRRSPGSRPGRGTADRAPVDTAELTLRLRYVAPYDAAGWLAHVVGRAIPGLERVDDERTVTRLLAAPGGPARVTIAFDPGGKIVARLALADLGDLAGVVVRIRRWLDLDADPGLVGSALCADPLLGPLVARRPGLRIPGTTDPFELAVRAVLGQQISVAGARTLAGRLVAAYGAPGVDGLRLFPEAAVLAAAGPDELRGIGLTGARAGTLARLAAAVAGGLPLTVGADRAQVRAGLLALPGIGPWTADYVALRALGDPDVFPAGDLVLRKALADLPGGAGHPLDIAAATRRAAAWSPWRGYAAQHLWTAWSARVAADAPVPA
ncbi:DNA-3-methyladenine glycosylase 2 family protein [Pengzhenrongella sicca]|uniref:DNA-3-methyladenine glycosylase 2 family protein n=1 Tax=Pengzhenrongella sicca TaxID=2819238 RepID=UPI001D0C3345|nr:DNA-3-methyladenine glycosylase 2 [Pengzhenrongella sicca]